MCTLRPSVRSGATAFARCSGNCPSCPGRANKGVPVQIRFGYELVYECPKPTPMILVLNLHYSRASDVVRPDHVLTLPSLPISAYRDSFGNWCSRIVAPRGETRISTDAI